MDIYSIPPLLCSLTALILGIFVFFKKVKSPASRAYTALCFETFWWQICWFISFYLTTPFQKDLIVRVGYSLILFLPCTHYHFVSRFLNLSKEMKWVGYSYLFGLFWLVLTWTSNLFIAGYYQYDWGMYGRAGILHPIYLAVVAVILARTLWLLKKSFVDTSQFPIKRNQNKFVFLATALYFIAGTEYLINYGFGFYPIGGFSIIGAFIVIAYAIVKYRLMDINLVLRGWLIFLPYAAVSIVIFSLLNILFHHSLWINEVIIFLLILSTPFLYQYIRKRFQPIVDTTIYKNKYAYLQKLEKFIEDILDIHKEEDLFNITAKKLSETLGVRKAGIFTIDNMSGDYILRAGIGLEKQKELKIPSNTDIAVWLKKNKEVFVKEEMEKVLRHTELEPIRETLGGLEAPVCVPILFEGTLVGIITLGEKSSGDMYSHIDTEILHHIGTQLAFALNYRRKEEELRREKELADIGIMTAEISHQLRNLLVPPRTFIELAPQRRDDDEFFGDFRKLAENQIAKLDKKLEYISLFGRSVKLKYESTDINQILDNILTEYGDKLKDITMVKEFSGLPLVRCDGEQVKLIFSNIITNSIEAMQDKPGGKLRVRTRMNENPAPDMKRLAERWIRVEIKDDGLGMKPEVKENLYTPFVTTKSVDGIKEKGAGLGLPIAKKIVDLHKGIIDVNSTYGKGTTVTVDLPVELKEEPKPPTEEMDAGMPPWVKGT